jgi:hypothetical protein
MDLESAIQSAQIISIQSVFTEKLKLIGKFRCRPKPQSSVYYTLSKLWTLIYVSESTFQKCNMI